MNEWLNSTSYFWTTDIGVHVVHTSCVVITYTLESLSSLTQITLYMQVTINFKKKDVKKQTQKKWGHPLSSLAIEDGNSTSVYNDSKYLTSTLTETEPHTAMTNKPEDIRRKDMIIIEKNIRKVTWNSKILKNKFKDSHSNFVSMFSSSKASRAIEKREGMAPWCWSQFVMTHEMWSTYST